MNNRADRCRGLADLRDIADSRALWEQIFPEDSEGFLDYYDTWKMTRNRIETRRSAGRLVSMIHWNPYRVHMHGETADSIYVIAVATLPEYRHRGMMAGQLRDGMQRFCRERIPFIFLMPADPEIYRPFDFRYVYDREILKTEGIYSGRTEEPVREGEIPGGKSGADRAGSPAHPGLAIRPLRDDEWAAAAALMERRLSAHYDCYAVRDRAYVERTAWECRSEGGDVSGIFDGERLAGCFSWWGEPGVEIREMIMEAEYEAPAKVMQVLEALRAWKPEAEEISVLAAGWTVEAEENSEQMPGGTEETTLPASEQEPEDTASPAGEWKTVHEPIIMARITCLAEFLRTMRSECPQQIILQVKDRYIPENDGRFLWKSGPEGSVLERAETAVPDASQTDIGIDIPDLALWLMGYRGITETGAWLSEAGVSFAEKIRGMRGCIFPEIV